MHFTRSNGVVTVVPTCDAQGQVENLHQIADQLMPGDHMVVIDLSSVALLRSPDMAQLVDLAKSVSIKGGSVSLRGCSPMVRKLLAMTRLDQLFSVAA
jgi:anti-anti-sigma factor